MTSAQIPWNSLVAHSASRSNAVRGIDVRAYQKQRGTFGFEYVLRAQMPQIRIPLAASAPLRADDLWRHTCFEAFIAAPSGAGYYELNFSPSRQWAIYSFSAYREGMSSVEVSSAPQVVVHRFDDRLELHAAIELPEYAAPHTPDTLRLALTAVVEDDGGTLSYWALKHAPGRPDFHHSDGFVLELTT